MYAPGSHFLFEYPLWLSYKPITLTVPPLDMVSCESKMHEALLPTMSLETSGASEYSRMSESSPSAADRKAAFTSSADASLEMRATKSVMEPSATGTRIDIPSTLPCSSGLITPAVRAAPVDVGTMLLGAERARLGSLWAASRRLWSLV